MGTQGMNSKAKGGAFERQVCVALSRWVTKGKRKDVFWRSAMSGGRASVNIAGDVRQCGDICAVAPEGNAFADQYYVECKHVKSLNFPGLIKGSGLLLQHWRTAQREAEKHHKMPILIARQNQSPTIFCTDCDFCEDRPILVAPRDQMFIYRFDDILMLRYA